MQHWLYHGRGRVGSTKEEEVVWSQESPLLGAETPQTSFYGLGCRKDYAPWVTCDLPESAIQAAAAFHRQAPVVTQFDRFLKPLSSQLVPALLLRHLLDNNCTLSHASGKYNQWQQLDLSWQRCQRTNQVTQKLTNSAAINANIYHRLEKFTPYMMLQIIITLVHLIWHWWGAFLVNHD